MIKIFLAEDEFIVREGIKNNIDWQAHGMDFCGEAGDGELALPLIRKTRPDILITDIKMPFMDGLELSKLVRAEFPETEIIILSGFAEFDYAKQAISLGVARYLTKPITGEDLIRELEELSSVIREKKQERELREKYLLEMAENSRIDMSAFFQDLVTGTKSATELLEGASKLGVDLSASWYAISLFWMRSEHHSQEEYSNSVVELEKKIREILEENKVLLFDRKLEGVSFLFKAESEEELEALVKSTTDEIEKVLADYPHVHFFGGNGSAVNRLRELPRSFEEASLAISHRFLMEGNRILDYENLGDERENEELKLDSLDLKQIDQRHVADFLRTGNRHEVAYFVEEYFRKIGIDTMESFIFRQYIALDIYFSVAVFAEEMGHRRDEIESVDSASGILGTVKGTQDYLVRILDTGIGFRESAAGNRFGEVVDKVMNYIETNYGDEDLSLNQLAAYINVSPGYLSTIFSQQTGETISHYLTEYRMNRAKQLLRCTGKRSSEIGLEVGYKDPHYFSFIFKKTQGMTPTQYREGTEGEEE